MRCPQCGREGIYYPDARYCGRCGRLLLAPASGPLRRTHGPRRVLPVLLALGVLLIGATLVMTRRYTAATWPENEPVPYYPYVPGGKPGYGSGPPPRLAAPSRTRQPVCSVEMIMASPSRNLPGRIVVTRLDGKPACLFDLGYTPERGRQMVRVEFQLHNLAAKALHFTPLDVQLRDHSGYWHRAYSAGWGGFDFEGNSLRACGVVGISLLYPLADDLPPTGIGIGPGNAFGADTRLLARLSGADRQVPIPQKARYAAAKAEDLLQSAQMPWAPVFPGQSTLSAREMEDARKDPAQARRRAFSCLKQAVRLCPRWPQARRALAERDIALRRYAEALAQLQTARAISPDDPLTLELMARLRATALPPFRRPRESRALAKGALRLLPASKQVLRTMARACWVCGERRQARAWIARAVTLYPDDPGLRLERAAYGQGGP